MIERNKKWGKANLVWIAKRPGWFTISVVAVMSVFSGFATSIPWQLLPTFPITLFVLTRLSVNGAVVWRHRPWVVSATVIAVAFGILATGVIYSDQPSSETAPPLQLPIR